MKRKKIIVILKNCYWLLRLFIPSSSSHFFCQVTWLTCTWTTATCYIIPSSIYIHKKNTQKVNKVKQKYFFKNGEKCKQGNYHINCETVYFMHLTQIEKKKILNTKISFMGLVAKCISIQSSSDTCIIFSLAFFLYYLLTL